MSNAKAKLMTRLENHDCEGCVVVLWSKKDIVFMNEGLPLATSLGLCDMLKHEILKQWYARNGEKHEVIE